MESTLIKEMKVNVEGTKNILFGLILIIDIDSKCYIY